MEQTPAKSESELPTLPDDVTVDMILPRLPVKPLTRFKSVSKFWLSTISSNTFAKTHLKFSSLSNTKSLIYKELFSYRNRGSYLSFDECDDMKEFVNLEDKYLNINDPRYTRRAARVVGSCNGLLCMFDSDVLEFILWNSVMNQYRNAGGPEFNYVLNDDVAGVGFGYISSIDDYKIGCLVHSEEGVCRVSVYSLKTGEWKETASIEEKGFFSIERRYYSVLVDDIIYWSPVVRREYEDKESHIVGLNLISGLLTKVPLGNLLTGYFDAKVFEIKGCLSLCCNSVVGRRRRAKRVSDVWTFKKNGDKHSWEKSFSINMEGITLLYIFESGKCLVSQNSNQLMLLDLSQAEYVEVTVFWQRQRRGNIYHRAIADVWNYTESLISPSGISARVVNEDGGETGERIEEHA
ncbi:F-box/kelch-repeat protein At3g23880-like [Chenopodium quinoa]|uniref:F-box associated beta-propeller type 1 domain-containing protein n=1 Tax=Chenopodium quinoa TaxID=63459 RepID=A0A803LE83_CHEQI|nr:F-box/kelch-repeat protein At3g23880-like [Chenopodium quinoa]